jgi:serine/threonine protein kinase
VLTEEDTVDRIEVVGWIEDQMATLGVTPAVTDRWICLKNAIPGHGLEGAVLYTQMVYVPSVTLAKWKPQTEDEVNQVCKSLLQKLQRMHQANIVHLDLHDENVLVDAKNNAWIIDWAKSWPADEEYGTTCEQIYYDTQTLGDAGKKCPKLIQYGLECNSPEEEVAKYWRPKRQRFAKAAKLSSFQSKVREGGIRSVHERDGRNRASLLRNHRFDCG